jgi:predicted DsbA family dithiol-disulfide isomerase
VSEQPADADPRVRVAMFFDFVCPWSYLGLESVERLAREHPVRLQLRPHLLRPEVPPEGLERPDPARQAETVAWLQELAPETAGRMVFGDRIRYSFLAFQGLELAADHDLAWPFAREVFDALWLGGEDIGGLPALRAAAARVELDPDVLEAALRSPYYLARALRSVNESRLLGITATPTLVIGRTRIQGWHYYEVLESVLEGQQPAPA